MLVHHQVEGQNHRLYPLHFYKELVSPHYQQSPDILLEITNEQAETSYLLFSEHPDFEIYLYCTRTLSSFSS